MSAPVWQLAEADAAALLRDAGFPDPFTVAPLAGGRNNRVFRVATAGRDLLLKAYFHDPQDPRDRLRQEVDFIRYAWGHEVRSVPECLHADRARHLALFEFVAGRKLEPAEIGTSQIDQAIAFFRETNRARLADDARTLLPASEACFSVGEHIAAVERRIGRLAQMEGGLPVDAEAAAFVADALIPLWRLLVSRLERELARDGLPAAPLPLAERRLSPSDFGYHNAILEESGRLRFLDFEYAGWDDPAKLVADFANQPDLILPDALSGRFTRAVIEMADDPAAMESRIGWLTPLYQIKWACIILNDFLPIGRNRRRFTGGDEESALKKTQLAKARVMEARARAALPA